MRRREHNFFQLSAAGEGEGVQGSCGGKLDGDRSDGGAPVGSQLLQHCLQKRTGVRSTKQSSRCLVGHANM